ncbi:MAG TPA: hypothetical protein VFV67_02415 [Actinophytocola sp.]|uniref:hypothetical protein n=1 Tax=Actinophytocola sp. TaxID=1872138 RepID=UPI002DB9AC22|nr:hypothetical protein [Actinophytocola sp.]HEU5469480.1 hypothetical protein [Actinophytocola sp.]
MSTEARTGGFVGDPAETFTPPAASGCCGSTPAPSTARGDVAVSTCCGSAESAATAGVCCDPAAKAEAIDAGAGCCG